MVVKSIRTNRAPSGSGLVRSKRSMSPFRKKLLKGVTSLSVLVSTPRFAMPVGHLSKTSRQLVPKAPDIINDSLTSCFSPHSTRALKRYAAVAGVQIPLVLQAFTAFSAAQMAKILDVFPSFRHAGD